MSNNNKIIKKIFSNFSSVDKHVLEKLGFSYFSYAEVYPDGKIRLMSIDWDLNEFYEQHPDECFGSVIKRYRSDFNPVGYCFYDLMSSPCAETLVIRQRLADHNHRHILVKVEPDVCGHLRFYSFAAGVNDLEINNFYLNNLNKIELLTKQISKDVFRNYKNFLKLPCYDGGGGLIVEKQVKPVSFHGSLNLTQRQKEVVLYLFNDFSNPQIAKVMNISLRGVENHLVAIKNKLWCERKEEIIYYLLRNRKIEIKD